MRLRQIRENDEHEESAEVARARELLDIAAGIGYDFIDALGESGGDSIYTVYALALDPSYWEPYKFGRCLEDANAYIIALEFNHDLTSLNMAGRLIYEEDEVEHEPVYDDEYEGLEDADEFEEGEHYPAWELVDELAWVLDMIVDNGPRLEDGRSAVLVRIEEVVEGISEGYEVDRTEAPRLDL